MASSPVSPRQALAKEIMELRLRYDVANNECKQVLGKLDSIRTRSTGFVRTEDLSADVDVDAAEIAKLEVDLERTAVRAYEAYETRKTHEQVIRRLKAEAATYPRALEGIGRTAHAKEHDYGTLQLMLKDASHVRDVGRQELSRVEEAVAHERKERARAIQARRRKMQQKQEATHAHEVRGAARREALGLEREASVERRDAAARVDGRWREISEMEMIAAYEEQFAQIKEVRPHYT